MPGKESNPIQQRMDLLLERWEAVIAKPGVNIVRIHAKDDEKQMVNAFYTYLLGIDTPTDHIPIIFESIYHDHQQYTKALLKELDEMLVIWNNANKDNLKMKTEKIDWQTNHSLKNKDNPVYAFVENMNRLATFMELQDCFLIAVLKVSFIQAKQFINWLELALKAGLNPNFKLLINDLESYPFFENFQLKYVGKVATLAPALDMENAMKQVSAMGNPNDPGVQYRKAFILLMQAISKRNEKGAEQHAAACIEIAIRNLKKSAYWLGQIIAVYTALANDQVGYKNYKKAIAYSTLSLQAAEKSKELLPDEIMQKKFIGQAIMLRGSLYSVIKEWDNAIADFKIAVQNYEQSQDFILAIEACRMIGFCAKNKRDNNSLCQAMLRGLNISRQIPAGMIKSTSFPAIVEMLLEANFDKYISFENIEKIVKPIYGNDWLKEIRQWKNPAFQGVDDPLNACM